MAEGRSADSREADFPGAVTCHLFRVLVRVDECGRAAANGGDGNRRPTRATRSRGGTAGTLACCEAGTSLQVAGDGHGIWEFRCRTFGSRPQDPDGRGPKCRFPRG